MTTIISGLSPFKSLQMIFKSNFYNQFKGFKNLLLLPLLILSFQNISAQLEIKTNSVSLSKAQTQKLSEKLKDFTVFTFNDEDLVNLLENENHKDFTLSIDNQEWRLSLDVINFIDPKTPLIVHTANGRESREMGNIPTFKGNIYGKHHLQSTFIISENNIQGAFQTKNNMYRIRKVHSFDKSLPINYYVLTKHFRNKNDNVLKNNFDPCGDDFYFSEEIQTFLIQEGLDDIYLTLAVAGDTALYNSFSMEPDPIQAVQDELCYAVLEVGILGAYFYLEVQPIHFQIWTPSNPEPFGTSVTAFKDYYSQFFHCIEYDVAHLASGKSGSGGANNGSVCFGDSNSNVSQAHSFSQGHPSGIAKNTMIHEIAHALNAGHIDNLCTGLCDDIETSPLMCAAGTAGSPYFVGRNQELIKKHIKKHIGCFTDFSTQFNDVCSCDDKIIFDVEPVIPNYLCEEDFTTYDFTMKMCVCEERDYDLSFRFGSTDFTIIDSDVFGNPENLGSTIKYSYKNVDFLEGECKTFNIVTKLSETANSPIFFEGIIDDSIATVPASTELSIQIIDKTVGQNSNSTNNISNLSNILLGPSASCSVTNSAASADFELNGTLIIDVPEYCFNGINIGMNAGAKIVVPSGSTLNIAYNTYLRACSGLWESIEVQNGGTLNIDNAIIEDGYTAVRAMWGSTVNITNTTFEENFIGLYAPEGGVNFGLIGGNTFDGGTQLLSPYNGTTLINNLPEPNETAFAGIWIDASTDYNSTFSITGGDEDNPHSVFKNISNGIYTKNATTLIQNCIFDNISNNDYPKALSGFGIRSQGGQFGLIKSFRQTGLGKLGQKSFVGCQKGIRVEGMRVELISGNNMSVQKEGIRIPYVYYECVIRNNNIRTEDNGINVVQWDASFATRIFDNDVRVEGSNGVGIQFNMFGITPFGGLKPKVNSNFVSLKGKNSTGIYLQSVRNAEAMDNRVDIEDENNLPNSYTAMRLNAIHDTDIKCNDINGNNELETINFGMDIWDGEGSFFSCNDISDTHTGISFTMGSMAEHQFKETSFNNHNRGLFIDGSAVIGQQPHHGNKWFGEYIGAGAVNEAETEPQLDASLFVIHTVMDTVLYPTISVGGGLSESDWFDIGAGNPSDDCGAQSDLCPIEFSPPPIGNDGGIDVKIKDGVLSFPTFNDEIKWLAERYLYRKLITNEVSPDAVFDEFVTETAQTTVGAFHNIESELEALFTNDEETINLLKSNLETLTIKLDELSELDNTLAVSLDDDAMMQRNLLIAEIADIDATLFNLHSTIQEQQATDAELIIGTNEEIATEKLFEQSEQQVNNIFLGIIIANEVNLEKEQIELLEKIANQCPLMGGTAVFKARSLLAIIGDYQFNDYELCELKSKKQSGGINALKLPTPYRFYPNPASNEVTIVLENELTNGRVSLSNVTGKEVLHVFVKEGVQNLTIKTDKLPQGVYWLNILDNGKSLFTNKLVIAR